MEVLISDINETRKEVKVSISGDEVRSEESSLLGEFSKQARIPGFRPGKAPKNLIEKRYKSEIKQELEKRVVTNAYRKAVEETKRDILTVVDLKEPDFEAEALELSVSFDVAPEFELPEYTGIEVTQEAIVVEDKEIDEAIDRVRTQRAEFKEVDDRPAAKGDYVKCSYEGRIGEDLISELVPGETLYGTQTATWEEVGAEEAPGVPAIVEGLAGMNVGDQQELTQVFADDFRVAELAGKTATYKVQVEEIRSRALPDLDEEFFKSIEVADLEALKEKSKQDLVTQKENAQFDECRRLVLEKIKEQVSFALPESAVEQETNGQAQNEMMQMMRGGKTQEEVEAQRESILEAAKVKAEEAVREHLLLMAIAKKEDIQIENEEMSRQIFQEAYMSGQKPEEYVEALKSDQQRLQALRNRVLINKTLDFLGKQATIKNS